MTDPSAQPPETVPPAERADLADATPGVGHLGLFRFTIEGRSAPALFVVGWLATIVGLAVAAIGYLAAGTAPAAILLVAGIAVLTIGLFLLAGAQAVERRVEGRRYAGPSPILVFAATITTSVLVFVLVGFPLDLLHLELDKAAGDLFVAALQAFVFVGVVGLLVVGPRAVTWREMGLTIPLRRALDALGWGILLAVPVVFVTGLVASVLVPLLGASPPSPLPPTGTTEGLALHLLAGAVAAPIGEEIVFRGVATTAWVRSLGERQGILRAAILFALAHVLFLGGTDFRSALAVWTVAAVGRFPIALALGWVYVRRGTLWASIGMHAAFNAILIILSESALRNLGV